LSLKGGWQLLRLKPKTLWQQATKETVNITICFWETLVKGNWQLPTLHLGSSGIPLIKPIQRMMVTNSV